MRILVIGGGGREHALCWKIAQSPRVTKLYCAPGNAGIADVAECVAIRADALNDIVDFAQSNAIGLVVVGPEDPLTIGLVDRLEAVGIPAFGPRGNAAILEGSKVFTKELCASRGIPTPGFARFRDAEAARAHLASHPLPVVIKADGLAAGKGVVIATTAEEANAAVDAALTEQRFGKAGSELVIEDFIDGPEVSFFALVDGRTALPLTSAQDYKRAHDGDEGPNTGGMGALSPSPLMTPELQTRILDTIIEPTIRAMAEAGRPYRGILYAGIILDRTSGNAPGEPKLLEYNVRFGDPEAEVILPRLKSDLVTAMLATRDGVLADLSLDWTDAPGQCVIMATKGYPGPYEKGSVIGGTDTATDSLADTTLFHCGTARNDSRQLTAAGGRVLCVTALGDDRGDARAKCYQALDRIDWPQGFCRTDIGAGIE